MGVRDDILALLRSCGVTVYLLFSGVDCPRVGLIRLCDNPEKVLPRRDGKDWRGRVFLSDVFFGELPSMSKSDLSMSRRKQLGVSNSIFP